MNAAKAVTLAKSGWRLGGEREREERMAHTPTSTPKLSVIIRKSIRSRLVMCVCFAADSTPASARRNDRRLGLFCEAEYAAVRVMGERGVGKMDGTWQMTYSVV